MGELESDMVDEMMQAALNLDVEAEIQRRLEMAKQLVAEGGVEESASRSVSAYNPSHQKSKKSKNVKFQPSPHGDRLSSSGSYAQHESSISRSKKGSQQIEESIGPDGEIMGSIGVEESLG